jgi:uncharacterized protein (DUF362 family)
MYVSSLSRRGFMGMSAQAIAALALRGAQSPKGKVALVASTHSKLAQPSSLEDPLDYPRVKDMVWKAIDYARPRAGSLEAKIKPGSWVVIKPNLIALPSRPTYRTGDVTDLRVTQAVLEYVLEKSKAGRVTVAEGGSYRRIGDTTPNNILKQNGVHVDALSADWGDTFAGFRGGLGTILDRARAKFPGKRIDYVDLSYDPVRDESGNFKWMDVPKSVNGIGAFGEKKVYVPANTIVNCDFLITVPVMKVHLTCGMTCCLKNYVGTGPRIVYAGEGNFSNNDLHNKHSLEGRIDSFITDLAAFHPPDYCVVDAIRGLQHSEHRIDRPDQEMRSNMILAGEDPVATDALAAKLIGYQAWDIEYLHMASMRGMGTFDLGQVEVLGDDPERLARAWGKPNNWYGRCNREWVVTQDSKADMKSWQRLTSPTDALHLARWQRPASDAAVYKSAVRVVAEGSRKGYLWVGTRGQVVASVNGEKVMEEEGLTRYRPGQFQAPIQLRSGENLLVFEVKPQGDVADLSVLITGPRNDGDTVDGIRWMA